MLLKKVSEDLNHLKKHHVMDEAGFSRSQLYSWLSGIEDRKKRASKIIPEAVAHKALEVIVKYPHMSAPKGQLYLIYHRLGYIPQHVYVLLRKTVRRLLFQEVSSRKLLPASTSYTHEKPSEPDQIWAEDFTQIRIAHHLFYVALLIDVASTMYLGKAVSMVADENFVEQAVIEALISSGGKGPQQFLLSDNGKQYIGENHETLLVSLEIIHKRIPSCRPEFNGSVECGVKEFKQVFYNVWAEYETKETNKEKILYDRVVKAISETAYRLNEEIPRPCLKGVTPYDVYCGMAAQKRIENEQYLAREQQRKEIKPWSKNRWQLASKVLKAKSRSPLEILTKFCFFLKRPLRRLPKLVDEVLYDTS